ncbi:MAG: hypothetical protein ACRCXB_27850 [Aeromonadaceae bacterium]
MNDKQQLAAMGGHPAEQPTFLQKRVEQLEAEVKALESRLKAVKQGWPDKCPITRRDFFMEIDGVPTYGGPYDSYTIPEMLGAPDQPWHDRELFVRRFDHDMGRWVDDEIISQRVIHDSVLDCMLDAKPSSEPEGWQLVPVKPTHDMLCVVINCGHFDVVQPEMAGKYYRAMLAAAPKFGGDDA